MQNAVFTSFNKAYLSRAITLAKSLSETMPDTCKVAFIVDETTSKEHEFILNFFDKVFYPKDFIDSKALDSWIFRYDVVEACTAIKGRALLHLLELGYEKVLYLDPDIYVFRSLDLVISELNSYSILLTPHQTDFNANDIMASDERSSLKHGAYNLGFLAVRNCPEAVKLASWWSSRLDYYCFDDVPSGIFTDQKWFDLVPCLFDNVNVLKHRGLNVASWNLNCRDIRLDITGNLTVNETYPLVFFHFTKISGVGLHMLETNSIHWPTMKEIYLYYVRNLEKFEQLSSFINKRWAYCTYDNGELIKKQARRMYRDRPDLQNHFSKPFGNDFFNYVMTQGGINK